MMILCDDREKKNDHIKRYFDRNGIPYRTQRLPSGDYMFEGENIIVERKNSVDEICQNLFLKARRARFNRELERVIVSKQKMYIVIETTPFIKCIRQVASEWTPKRSRVPPKIVARELQKIEMAYHIPIIFTTRRNAGRVIYDILKGRISIEV